MKPLVIVAAVLVIMMALGIGVSLPDIQRYLKMRAM